MFYEGVEGASEVLDAVGQSNGKLGASNGFIARKGLREFQSDDRLFGHGAAA